MNPAVVRLYESAVSGTDIEQSIVRLAVGPTSYDAWALGLVRVDAKIGGFGVHNISRVSTHQIPTGTYAETDRQMFRGIQYCAGMFLRQFNTFDTRACVDYACSHLESVAKLIVAHAEPRASTRSPLGQLLPIIRSSKAFGHPPIAEFVSRSSAAVPVFNAAKHQYDAEVPASRTKSPLDVDAHLFTFEDALATYFSSRMIATPALEFTFSIWRTPKSMGSIPTLSRAEQRELVALESFNLRKWASDLAAEGCTSVDDFLLKKLSADGTS
jgi:hypothetical protein